MPMVIFFIFRLIDYGISMNMQFGRVMVDG